MSAPVVASVHPGRGRLALRCMVLLALLVSVWGGAGAALAATRGETKVVLYRGYSVVVPAGWPVYNLAASPSVCVRFNRNAVYLGLPGSEERCPAHSVGRTEAILIEPLAGGVASVAAARAVPGVAVPEAEGGRSSSGQLAVPARGVSVTATWHEHPAIVERALGTRGLPAAPGVPATRPPAPGARARVASAAGIGDPVYTGRGFDACSAPSVSQMSAWGSSPYRAVGIYIGGTNVGCAQPNLTAAWVNMEVAAGWHLIPTYVGLQAPGNSCGCTAINPGQAPAEGAAAATDAVSHAQALGIGAGNPIYFDMEAYATGGSNTSATLAFLAAWTAQLHAEGYESGVYTSAGSGVSDLVAHAGTGYKEPDDIWNAEWNGEQTTGSAYIPSGDWSDHHRLHQYSGDENVSYGGVTLNIDGDYLDGATAGSVATRTSSGTPVTIAPPSISGHASEGQTLVEARGTWSNDPTSYSHQWEDCNSAGADCSKIPGATGQRHTITRSDMGHTIRVQETASNADGTGGPATSAATRLVHGGSYWLYTAYGNVYHSSGAGWYGSPYASRVGTSSIVGMASTANGRGYWLVASSGRVYAYGDAAALPALAHAHPIKGIVADPSGGYWLYTAYGNVYYSSGAGWYGSPYASRVATSSIVGMASTANGRGYWLVASSGRVYAYGDAAALPALAHAHPIKGIVADPSGGYWLYTAYGNVYYSSGAGWYGSPYASRVGTSSIVGMASTANGKGYWLVDSAGNVYPYGDAASLAALAHAHPIKGIAP